MELAIDVWKRALKQNRCICNKRMIGICQIVPAGEEPIETIADDLYLDNTSKYKINRRLSFNTRLSSFMELKRGGDAAKRGFCDTIRDGKRTRKGRRWYGE